MPFQATLELFYNENQAECFIYHFSQLGRIFLQTLTVNWLRQFKFGHKKRLIDALVIEHAKRFSNVLIFM